MIVALLQRVFTRRLFILLLSLAAWSCLPLAARDIVRDAGFSLLLPVTIIALLCAWALGAPNIPDKAGVLLLALGGPAILFLYVGHLWQPLAAFFKTTLLMLPPALEWGRPFLQPDPPAWLRAAQDLLAQTVLIAGRVAAWLEGTPDPMARALVGSTALWCLAAWGGWQLRRKERAFAALAPTSLALGWVLVTQGQHLLLFWVHLAAVLALLGLVQYERQLSAWQAAGRDYVEFTGLYFSLSAGVLSALLVGAAYLASVTSVQELLDKLREQRPAASASENSSEVSTGQGGPRAQTGELQELMAPHRILAGPELSEEIVMVVATGDLPSMPRFANPTPPYYYWRTITYERYDGRGWNNPERPAETIIAGQELLKPPPDGYRRIHQEVRFPRGSSGRLYWSGSLLSTDVPAQVSWHGSRGWDLLGAFSEAEAYSADSIQPEISPEQLRAAAGDYPAWVEQRYLDVPDRVPERVLALARDLTARAATPFERAAAIQAYLRTIPYSLDVPAPPPGQDAVDYFLFDLEQGYCDYYATAMVVLSRAAGLPARFVTGYASGSYEPENAMYLVRASDAHSWAEIYFAGIGWVEFEPTASQPLPAWEKPAEGHAAASPAEQQPNPENAWTWQAFSPGLGSLPSLALLLIAAALAWEPVKIRMTARLRPSAAPGMFYRQLRRAAQPLTGAPPPSQTVQEYQLALGSRLADFRGWIRAGRTELEELSAVYSLSLFAARAPGRQQVMAAGRAWSRLRWRLLAARWLAVFKKQG